jgi:hypothetical protein
MKKEEISLKNTKAEILEALNEALEREKNISKNKSNPEKEESERKVKKAIEASIENVEKNIFSAELINKFKDLEVAIAALEEKLKNLYGIEGELNNLTLVMNAGKDAIAEIENNKRIETERLKDSIKELEDEYKNKSLELQKEYDLKAKALKLERDREVEEYNYKTKREREISNNQWEDEKRNRESILKAQELETKGLLDEAKANASNIKELELKVNEIPALLDKEYARGRKDATSELEKENKYAMELLKKDFQSMIDRQEDKITSLKEELDRANKLNVLLQEKTDKAYIEVKELATKTVEATGGVKIIGNNQSEIK